MNSTNNYLCIYRITTYVCLRKTWRQENTKGMQENIDICTKWQYSHHISNQPLIFVIVLISQIKAIKIWYYLRSFKISVFTITPFCFFHCVLVYYLSSTQYPLTLSCTNIRESTIQTCRGGDFFLCPWRGRTGIVATGWENVSEGTAPNKNWLETNWIHLFICRYNRISSLIGLIWQCIFYIQQKYTVQNWDEV